MRHDRRWFGRLEQEDQRSKKHYGRWMDIVRSLELESFILTKLTKPLVRVNLVGPQVSFRNGAPQMSGGGIIFREIRWPVRWVPAVRWRNNYFARNKEPIPCGWHGPSCQPIHVQYSFDGSRSLTTLTTPR